MILPTVNASHNLILDFNKAAGMPVQEEKGRELARRLAEAGAKKISVGGMETGKVHTSQRVFEHEKKWLAPNRVPSEFTVSRGCAGLTYKNLIDSGLFERVRLVPNAVFPEVPDYRFKRVRRPAARKAKKSVGRTRRK